MSILPIQALAGLGLLQAAASLPAVMRSADFAGLLRNALGGGSDRPGDAGPSTALMPAGSIDAGGLRSQTVTLTNTFETRLNHILGENGLNSFPGMHLRLDGAGRMRIAGDHPQKESIEAVIAAHPELADIFRAISANLQALRAIESPPNTRSGDQSATVDLFVDSAGVKASLLQD